MKKVFCQCDKCKKDIFVGDTTVTLSVQKERIEDEACVQPLEGKVISTWCESCGDQEMKNH